MISLYLNHIRELSSALFVLALLASASLSLLSAPIIQAAPGSQLGGGTPNVALNKPVTASPTEGSVQEKTQ